MEENEEMGVDYDIDDPEALSCLEETLSSSANSGFSVLDSSASEADRSVDSEDDEPSCSSTPKTKKKGSGRAGGGKSSQQKEKNSETQPQDQLGTFKKPEPPKYFAKCPLCRSVLKTLNGFKNHKLMHKWKDLAAKQLSEKDLKAHCTLVGVRCVQEIKETRFSGKMGEELKELAASVEEKSQTPEWTVLLDTLSAAVVKCLTEFKIGKKGATFASSTRQSLQQNVSAMFSDKDFRDDIIEKLIRIKLCTTSVAYPFLLELYRKLGNSTVAFLIRSFGVRDNVSSSARDHLRSKDDFSSNMSHKIVHFIAGATMRAQFRHAYRYKNNAKLKRIKNCIVKKIASIGVPSVCQERDKSYWTQQLNRKSLMFVNDPAFEFFLELAQVLQKIERPDGSLGHEAVMDVVAVSPSILSKWDVTVGNELEEEESFSFMVKVVRTFTNTYGRGVLLRRMNQLAKRGQHNKATASVSHRAKLL